MRQNAPFTWRSTPSGLTTAMPIEVRSNASLRRSKSKRLDSHTAAFMSASAHLRRSAHRRRCRRLRERFAEDDAEALREGLEGILLDGEVDQLLGLEDLPRYVFGAAQGIG